MNDETNSKSWLDRLTHLLTREPQNRSELLEILKEAVQSRLLDHEALSMIEGVLRVSEIQVRDIMVPRAQMVVIEADATPEQTLPLVTESGHSRFPVIGENRDHIKGILLAKDLLKYTFFTENSEQIKILDLIRPPIFVPESKRLNILLKEFRLKRQHMAMVVDEYGNIAGLITIEDVLEQIVGSIEDEYDTQDQEPDIHEITKNHYIVKALIPIEKFNEFFGLQISSETYDTLAGYLLHQLGHMPKSGESITVENLTITVMLASRRQLQLLKVSKK